MPEIIHTDHPRGPFRTAIFDFDGTLSLLRRNWQDVMIPMMADLLLETGTQETRDDLLVHVENFVMRLNGRQTIYQMIQLAEEIERRGGVPEDPLVYKHRYHDLLMREVDRRVAAVRSGEVNAEAMTVPGARDLLETLQQHGLELYLASGTDVNFVKDELETLGLASFFGPHVYGALDDYKKFSKAMIIDRIVQDAGVPGPQLVGFGDGFVEIEEVKRVGGLAIGVASNEDTRTGVNAWKRNRLVEAGADLIVGDYRDHLALRKVLGIHE